MVYFLVHSGTEKVFFENRKNLMNTLKKSIDLAESECRDGFDFSITVGCAKNTEQANQPDSDG